jgi:hypothetical protein
MKKRVLLAYCACAFVAATAFGDYKDFDDIDLAEMGVSQEYCETLEHSIVLLDKALEVELSEIAEQLKQETFSLKETFPEYMTTLVRIGELVRPKMDVMAIKAAQVIKNDMTIEEREIVTAFLHDLKAASSITSNDLFIVLEGLKQDGFGAAFKEATAKYCPKELLKHLDRENNHSLSGKDEYDLIRKFEHVDLHNAAFNIIKNVLCRTNYVLRNLSLINSFDHSLFLQQWSYSFSHTMVYFSSFLISEYSCDIHDKSQLIDDFLIRFVTLSENMYPAYTKILEALEQE